MDETNVGGADDAHTPLPGANLFLPNWCLVVLSLKTQLCCPNRNHSFFYCAYMKPCNAGGRKVKSSSSSEVSGFIEYKMVDGY